MISGSHAHTFANPMGSVFRIGCFQAADGCGDAGTLSSEFTWFAGFAWRVAFCRTCLTHLGWHFLSSAGNGFYGLILERLVVSR